MVGGSADAAISEVNRMIDSIITCTLFPIAECYVEEEIVEESDVSITNSYTCYKNSYDTESTNSSRHGVRLWT